MCQQADLAEPTVRLSEVPPCDGRGIQRARAGGEGPRVEPTHLHHGRRCRGCLRPRLAPLGRGDTGKK
eukprot:3263747-Pyramimonas_sp.AAC.1